MSRESTAYHEAAHIVAARCLGVAVFGASIGPDDNSLGRAYLSPAMEENPPIPCSNRERNRWEKRVVVLMAGKAAQRKFNARSLRCHHWLCDQLRAWEMLSCLSPSRAETGWRLRVAELRAEELVNDRVTWRKIRFLAGVLMKHEYLSRVGLLRILRHGMA